ncbi:hypothetical protein COCC4DRAFT_34214 [Bipolaris maydis ATCC 48331]|uniref:Uncharacterized protein n=2 Tax=Cochliobolus heterostrophus TaxID=5016 RepID=M2V5D0_COCH5|nr:uncharacterized protein COCC4DRAFT_34214 [Bipolaris maydis ATCC 48331]EMD95198.1 hypothetical protein COCHEDRAFT_1019982 [Bipolaris maydis C5]ENI00910.1 hypothetical protein COCC4DRAFT_34214 [Bipolaris maydis ATCC 48331]KAJ6214219.1 hypothetical protein PSV09DRAFT_1019982 [Bipolaris maydis]
MHWQPLDQVAMVLTDYYCNYALSLPYPLFLVAWWLRKPLSTPRQSPHGEAGCSPHSLSITIDILGPRSKPSQRYSRYIAILLGDLDGK